jgi:radical SAM superfamily enzyme with C-terminal helix-hairpin-helix motif
MRTIIYTTVRAEIEHFEPFESKHDFLKYAQEILDYSVICGVASSDKLCRVVDIEVVDDEVMDINQTEDELAEINSSSPVFAVRRESV